MREFESHRCRIILLRRPSSIPTMVKLGEDKGAHVPDGPCADEGETGEGLHGGKAR